MFADAAISIALLLIFQYSGISRSLAGLAFRLSPGYYGALLIYLTVFGAMFYLVTLPLGLYSGFFLERKFSLSNQDLAAWAKEEAKKVLLSSAVSLAFIGALYFILNNCGPRWWIVASAFSIMLSLVFARVFPVVVLPIFYRYNKLPDNDLRTKALSLAAKFGIKVMDVFEIDFSKNTKKANAAVIGVGRSRRIVMADNLIKEFKTDESLVVLAHELAHHKLSHFAILMTAGAVSTTLFYFLLSRLPFGIGITDISVFPMLYLAFLLYNMMAMPFENSISRKLEKDADTMALKMTGMREEFISMMAGLAEKNLADERPSPVIEALFYSHPPISKRIDLARKISL